MQQRGKALAGKPDATVEEAADLLYGPLSPELYLVFVRETRLANRTLSTLGRRPPCTLKSAPANSGIRLAIVVRRKGSLVAKNPGL